MLLRCLPGLLLALSLVGCATSPATQRYVLESLPITAGAAVVERRGLAVGVGQVTLPAYLAQDAIVQRRGNRLLLDESRRWAEPLGEAVPRVLAVNLANLLPTHRIVQQPWTLQGRPDWKLMLRIDRFEALDGRLLLQATWSLLDPDGRVVRSRQGDFSKPLAGEAVADIVAAHSEALAALSEAISDDIRQLPPSAAAR